MTMNRSWLSGPWIPVESGLLAAVAALLAAGCASWDPVSGRDPWLSELELVASPDRIGTSRVAYLAFSNRAEPEQDFDGAVRIELVAGEGSLELGQGRPVWRAPAVGGRYDITVRMTDLRGLSMEQTVTIDVVEPAISSTAIRAVALGSTHGGVWDRMNTEWSLYGTAAVSVDLDRFAEGNFSYEDLLLDGADTLILGSHPPTVDRWQAVRDYVRQGHGFVAAATTIDGYTGMMGLSDIVASSRVILAGTPEPVDILLPDHPLFVGMSGWETGASVFWVPAGVWSYAGDAVYGLFERSIRSPKGHSAAIVWFEHGSSPQFTPIYTLDGPYYRAVYAGPVLTDSTATRDDMQFLYNAITCTAGSME